MNSNVKKKLSTLVNGRAYQQEFDNREMVIKQITSGSKAADTGGRQRCDDDDHRREECRH